MSQVRYLIDESLPRRLLVALRRREPAIEVFRVGQPSMPPFGSVDPDLLDFCEQTQRMLISLDRRSMPGHVTAFLAAQRHTWGVGLVTGGATLQRLIEDLRLIWSASDAEEWRDRLFYLPLG